MAYTRALLKLSGEALMGNQGYGIDPEIVQAIAEDVAKVVASGTQLAIELQGLTCLGPQVRSFHPIAPLSRAHADTHAGGPNPVSHGSSAQPL